MLRYPVQRQRFPLNRRGRSASSAEVTVSVDAVTTMPAVQKPHWNPAASTNRCCTGARCSGVPSPAAVVTARPATRWAGMMQEWTGSPSISTPQAPQSPASQPFFTAT
jgi:hypothetical protein